MYKIAYVNGYNGQNSSKVGVIKEELTKVLKDIEVLHIPVEYKDGFFDGSMIDDFLELHDINLIIASSMGGFISKFFAYKYNIPLVSLNPMIDYNKSTNTKNITFDKKFDGSFGIQHTVLLNKDDELISYLDTFELFNNKADVKVFETGGHRFTNIIEDGIPSIINIINIINRDLNYQ